MGLGNSSSQGPAHNAANNVSDKMEWWIETFVWILPAFCANAIPVVISKFNLFGLRRPIDGGRNAPDGKRWLGDGKTWQGFISAILAGTVAGHALSYFQMGSAMIGGIMGFGAIFGDAVGSLIKRRMGLKRGANAGLFERVDFLVFSLAFSIPFVNWGLKHILLLFVTVPVIHRVANIIGYKLKMKDVPW